MPTLSKKLQNLLFGDIGTLNGEINIRSNISMPKMDGGEKTFYWEGNKGLIITLLEKIEVLEEEVNVLKIKK